MSMRRLKVRRRGLRQGDGALPYVLLFPSLVLLAGMAYPFGLGVYYSFTNYWLEYPNRFRFIGLRNYTNLFQEPLFSKALEFTILFTIIAVVLQVGLGLAVALFLHARVPGRNILRAMMLMPLMIPPVITALMWKVMMDSSNSGILNYLLSFIGLGPVNWFGSTQGAVVSILIIDTWGNLPFVSLILLGALQALPVEPYEAAKVDGASAFDTFRYLTLPLAKPFIILAATFRVMDSLRIFDVVYATTSGGPNDATTNLAVMAYRYAFQWYQMGKGMAQALVLLLLVVLASYVLISLWNRSTESATR